MLFFFFFFWPKYIQDLFIVSIYVCIPVPVLSFNGDYSYPVYICMMIASYFHLSCFETEQTNLPVSFHVNDSLYL